jgi:hypothetical protein
MSSVTDWEQRLAAVAWCFGQAQGVDESLQAGASLGR